MLHSKQASKHASNQQQHGRANKRREKQGVKRLPITNSVCSGKFV